MNKEGVVHIYNRILFSHGFTGGSDGKESACKAGDPGSIPGSGRSWKRKWQPTLVFLPGESYGQRSLAGYSPWGHKVSDMTQRLTLSLSLTHPQDLGQTSV